MINNCLPNGQGVKEQIYVGTLDQLLVVTDDATDKKLVTNFTLKTGEKLRLWEGYKLSSGFTLSLATSEAGNKIVHGFNFTIYDNSTAADAEVDKIMSRTDLFAVVKQNGAFGRWRMLGFTTGLQATSLDLDSNNADFPGQYRLQFVGAQEIEVPRTFKHVTAMLEDTEVYLRTLIVVPV